MNTTLGQSIEPSLLGERIKTARLSAGYATQGALAQAAGVSQATVSRAEQGEPVSTLVLHRLAAVTARGLDYFLSSVSDDIAIQLRAPQGSNQSVAAAIDFATQLLRDLRFVRELSDAEA